MASDETMTASVAGRYASALFELAQEQRIVPQVEGDLTAFKALLDDSADLRSFVRSPVLSTDDQVRALSAVLARAGISGITANFLTLVARNRRLFVVGDMVTAFKAIAARARGEVSAEVASAVPLSDAQTAALQAELAAMAGRTVVLTTKVDPSLLGGLVVKMGSRMIDSSLKTKLASLGVALKAGA